MQNSKLTIIARQANYRINRPFSVTAYYRRACISIYLISSLAQLEMYRS